MTTAPAAELASVQTPSQVRRHWEMLVCAGTVTSLSLLLQLCPDGEHVAFLGLPCLTLPGTCLSRELFGVRCPACGMTRSFICLAHGDLAASFHYHHLGWLMALLLLVQVPYRIACLRRGRTLLGPRASGAVSLGLIGLLIGNWLVEVVATRSLR